MQACLHFCPESHGCRGLAGCGLVGSMLETPLFTPQQTSYMEITITNLTNATAVGHTDVLVGQVKAVLLAWTCAEIQ